MTNSEPVLRLSASDVTVSKNGRHPSLNYKMCLCVFRRPDGRETGDGQRPLAAACAVLPTPAEVGHRQEVHGRLRDAGSGTAGPHGRTGNAHVHAHASCSFTSTFIRDAG